MHHNNTIGYYNNHADKFYESTVNVEFATMQKQFLSKLSKGSHILDFGCGSGRVPLYYTYQLMNL